MNKTNIVVLMFGVFLCLLILHGIDLPQIELPKSAQHNNIGELPIVEMADDGVFAEEDGAEAEVASYWCDELNRGFTCQLKFGMSYSVATRIGKEEFFKTCEEAKIDNSESFEYCVENVSSIKYIMESYRLSEERATKFYYDSIDMCWERHQYIPECHGSYRNWLYDYHTGGLIK